MDSDTARGRIAERVKNAYAAGHNDGRKGPDRMDEVAETETGKILEVVREALLSEAEVGLRTLWAGDRMADMQRSAYTTSLEELWQSAFGADEEAQGE